MASINTTNLLSLMAPNQGVSQATVNFNNQLIDVLKRQQQLGTLGLQERQMQYENEQADRVLTPLEPTLTRLSPQAQTNIIGARQAAIQPSIEGVQGRAKTFSEQLESFGNMLSMARQLSDDYENRKLQREQFAQQMALERAKLSQSGSAAKQQWETVVGADEKLYAFNPYTKEMSLLNEGGEPTLADQIKSMKAEGWGAKDVADYFTSQKMSVPSALLESIYGIPQYTNRYNILGWTLGKKANW